LSLPPVETKIVNVTLTGAEREFYDALNLKSQSIFDDYVEAGTASKSWFAIFSLLARLRMACDHIALTVKSHIEESDWNIATRNGPEGEEGEGIPTAPSAIAMASDNDALDNNVSFIL
jgi:SNF2 family DNA or RNA helicase